MLLTVTSASPRGVSEALSFGRTQWQTAWRPFASQWTQPKLMKLAAETLGENALHSSQIHGFSTGKLRDPAPKVLRVIGLLNLALAQANGEDVESAYRCPMNKPELWRGKRWLRDAEGNPLNPATVFLAITGDIDLGMSEAWVMPEDSELLERIEQAIGKRLRRELAKDGIDWYETPLPEPIQSLLINEGTSAKLLVSNAEMIAELCHTDPRSLWDDIVEPVIKDHQI